MATRVARAGPSRSLRGCSSPFVSMKNRLKRSCPAMCHDEVDGLRRSPHVFWGKLARSSCPPAIHPLVDHALDVAVVLRHLIVLPDNLRRLEACCASTLNAVAVDRIAAIAVLHDVGKCNRGFQAKRDPNAARTTGHTLEAAALLSSDRVRSRWPSDWLALVEQMCTWFCGHDEQLMSLLLAAISHHGRPVSYNDISAVDEVSMAYWWSAGDGIDPMQGVSELVACVRQNFPGAFLESERPLDATPEFQQRFAGLVMLADWIGSDTRFFPYRADASEDRLAFATSAAQRALKVIGLEPPARRQDVPFARLFPGYSPTPLQTLASTGLAIESSSRLVLIESDTGSGKTEAALSWFVRLHAAEEVDGLYFALPTRVAARELYERVRSAVERGWPDATTRPGPVLLAAPGYVKVDGEKPVLPDSDTHLWEDDESARRAERQWASSHPKRFLAAPVAVGTIDQALLSVLAVKHSLLRSVCLDRHLLVVDEVHASDPYMRQLLDAVLTGHLRRGGWAMLLSATLGEVSGCRFFGRPMVPLADAAARSYPCVQTQAGTTPVRTVGDAKRLEVRMTDNLDDASLVEPIAGALRQGARVLVICNTVARANSMLRAMEASGAVDAAAFFSLGGVVCPHHGRFTRDHREHLDAAISARLGKRTPDGPLLLIGTQTLEQSLDIDADWLVTDLCPMDVLLQRIGRLHRHRRCARPAAFAAPSILLRVPEQGDLSRFLRRDGSMRAPAGLGTVYPDGRILQRTIDLLRDASSIEIPRDNRELIESSTHPGALAELGSTWQRHGECVEGQVIAQVRTALTGVLRLEPFGELHYASDGARLATRLGAENLDLPLAHPVSPPFGILSRSVCIPAHMAPRHGIAPDHVDAEACEGGFRFALGDRHYRYTRFGLELDEHVQPAG